MDIKEAQKIEYNILKEIANFCKNNNIKYFLAGGTLLGATRHNGFIPWDDDVDLFMKREQYMLFINKWNNKGNRYQLLSVYNDKNHIYPFIKVVDSYYNVIENNGDCKHQDNLGLWVDIFPIDNYSPFNYYLINITYHIYSISKSKRFTIGPKLKRNPILIPIKFIVKKLFNNTHKIAFYIEKKSQYSKQSSKLCALTTGVGKRDIFDSKWFSCIKQINFEDSFYPAPVGYKEYLKKRYGDYMTLPPVDERNINHKLLIKSINNDIE